MNKILVVDDDDDILDTIQLILEIGGYEINPLNQADQVFETIKNFKPSLILLDVVLGKIDGREICEQIKNNPGTAHIPVLMMSALYDMGDIREMNSPPDDFIPKPFKMDVLLEKIGTLIGQKKTSRHDVN
ncbi:Response regulator MprA [compost metagenome]